jgi:NAD(P)H-hydrate epimerase
LKIEEQELRLPLIQKSRHKYEAGYVLGVAGSEEMPGAAALSSEAVLRSGAGVVRLFTDHPCHLRNEVIREKYSLPRIKEEAKRANSCFIGPGLGRTKNVEKRLKALLGIIELPCVIDGDALFFLSKNLIPRNAVLTPHHGEMERLLKKKPTPENCQKYAEENKTTVVLKGSETTIFHPKKKPVVSTHGDPGMATAGTGDVLTGIIAGLLAQKMTPYQAALLGVYLHGIAGELAADALTSYCMIASDLLDVLPIAFANLER